MAAKRKRRSTRKRRKHHVKRRVHRAKKRPVPRQRRRKARGKRRKARKIGIWDCRACRSLNERRRRCWNCGASYERSGHGRQRVPLG